jgi:hypothetical protein
MKVWIVSTDCGCGWYGGIDIVGYYSTEEKAKAALAEVDEEFYDITEVEVE